VYSAHRRMNLFSALGSKWLLTLSNLFALYPACKLGARSDRVILLYACFSSMIHHACEVRYYEPALLKCSVNTQWWLLKNDQFGAVLAILTLGSWKLFQKELNLIAIGLTSLLFSELVMFLPIQYKIFIRTVSHTVWHFLSLGLVASRGLHNQKEERFYEWIIRRLLGIVD